MMYAVGMERREFLKAGLAVACGAAFARASVGDVVGVGEGRVMTVAGPMAAGEMGLALTHEHVLVDFAGAEVSDPGSYDLDEAFAVVLPHLRRARELGCRTFMECTPAYIGRSPRFLARLAEASGMRILTNTGYYGAAGDKYLPPHAYRESASELAARWTLEWDQGIEGTGIRPGFIKIGVDSGPLSEVDRKLVHAAARTHLRTGLTIMSHTGPRVPAFEQLAVLGEEGVSPAAWIWTHAQGEPDEEALWRAAGMGAWVALDGVDAGNVAEYVSRLRGFRERGLLGRILLSHDAGWYSPGEPGGGSFRPFDTLATRLLPALRDEGFADAEIRQMTEINPAHAFTIGVRRAT